MKKVFGQTVRDLKREVNKKVLKVPGIEQKVLDATSNEPWGPHGSLLADLAQASRNYHEYQLIMGVIWKRLSDTGKNWRHVYKALTVLEYMVGHGSERVIEDIRERAYQISTLSDFQYIDSGGRDQGNNVRKKSQSLVALVNDKERIAEVRQKAAANRDKYRSSPGGMYKPSGGYGDKYDYGSRDEERSSYGREREYGYRDDDRNSRDGDRHSRDSEDRYGRDGNRDDDNRGRSRSVDNFQYGSRGRSSDRERGFEDDGHSSSRGSGARADDTQDGRPLERKFSEQNIGAPPSYEEAVSESRSPVYSERNGGETPQVAAPGAASPPPTQVAAPGAASPPPTKAAAPGAASPAGINTDNKAASFVNESSPQKVETFDEFDPRGAFSAGPPAYASTDGVSAPPTVASMSAPPTSSSVEMDLLGSLADVFSSNAMAIVPVETTVDTSGQESVGPAPSFSTSQPSTQPFDDPFGDSPFKAFISTDTESTPPQSFGAPLQPTPPAFSSEVSHSDTSHNFGFEDSFSAIANPEPSSQNVQPPSNSPGFSQEQFATSQSDIDILAGILPPSEPPVSLPQQSGPSIPTPQFPPSGMYEGFHPQPPVSTASNMPGQTPFGQAVQQYNMVPQSQGMTGAMPYNSGGFMHQPGSQAPFSATLSSSQTPYSTPNGPAGQFMVHQGHGMPTSHGPQRTQSGPVTLQGNNTGMGDMFSQAAPNSLTSSSSHPDLTPLTGAIEIVPPPQKKFEPKSSVWADTLSRGLVNFNISGPKTNPLADIGVDFEAINRREKRLEKPTNTPVTSTINMGKAMGSGTGMGRAGATAMRPPPNPMVGSGMPMGGGMGGGGYGGMNQNQPMGMGMRPGMNQNQPMGMGMGPGMNQNQPMGMGMGPGMNQNQPMGMGMGPGMNQNQPMGMGMGPGMNMNMGGYGQGYPMQQQNPGMVPGPNMPSNNYNPMMGQGGYNPQ